MAVCTDTRKTSAEIPTKEQEAQEDEPETSVPEVFLDLPSKYCQTRPITVKVGDARKPYYLSKDILAAKSPYFATQLKQCWDGAKDEIDLPSISTAGFEVVLDWMYTGQLPSRAKEHSIVASVLWLSTYHTVDVLMISKLQNELIANEAAMLTSSKSQWDFGRLQDVYENELCHTKYYEFVLRSAVRLMMKDLERSESFESIKDNAKVLCDVHQTICKWLQCPWRKFPEGDLSEFYDKAETTSP